jgi:hypothetical protein
MPARPITAAMPASPGPRAASVTAAMAAVPAAPTMAAASQGGILVAPPPRRASYPSVSDAALDSAHDQAPQDRLPGKKSSATVVALVLAAIAILGVCAGIGYYVVYSRLGAADAPASK